VKPSERVSQLGELMAGDLVLAKRAEIAAAVHDAVLEEREACALLWDSIPNHCDHDIDEAQKDCKGIGPILRYRDAIRSRQLGEEI